MPCKPVLFDMSTGPVVQSLSVVTAMWAEGYTQAHWEPSCGAPDINCWLTDNIRHRWSWSGCLVVSWSLYKCTSLGCTWDFVRRSICISYVWQSFCNTNGLVVLTVSSVPMRSMHVNVCCCPWRYTGL
jgi:hypothetical protein